MKTVKMVMFVGLFLLSGFINADQRAETVGGFCHFVTPDGFRGGNDDAEVFYANCENSIDQNLDGTGDGSAIVKVRYPADAEPFTESYTTTGVDTGVDCVLVDSNGTTYVTRDWWSTYTYRAAKKHGPSKFRMKRRASIAFELVCKNGMQV